MLFPTIRFALFFMMTWGACLAVRERPVERRLVLLAASWVFYASWDWRWLALVRSRGRLREAVSGVSSAMCDGS